MARSPSEAISCVEASSSAPSGAATSARFSSYERMIDQHLSRCRTRGMPMIILRKASGRSQRTSGPSRRPISSISSLVASCPRICSTCSRSSTFSSRLRIAVLIAVGGGKRLIRMPTAFERLVSSALVMSALGLDLALAAPSSASFSVFCFCENLPSKSSAS